MPSRGELRKHGGVKKVRTQKLPGGRHRHIYIMNDDDTLASETKHRKPVRKAARRRRH